MTQKFTQADFLRIAEQQLGSTKRYYPDSPEINRLTFIIDDLKSKQ